MDCGYLTVSVLKGFLSHIMDISVTYVNAPVHSRGKEDKGGGVENPRQ